MDLENYPDDAETLCFHTISKILAKAGEGLPNRILKFTATCYDLEKTKDYLLNPDIREFSSWINKLVIIGYAERIISNEGIENVEFFPISERITKQYSIIESHNLPTLIWHEPFHNGGRHPRSGGFYTFIDLEEVKKKGNNPYEIFGLNKLMTDSKRYQKDLESLVIKQ